jgi:uncharacterized protein (UPF0335 family)
VFDGLAIYQILNRHPARKVVHIDGIAASIASAIAMVGDEIEIAESARLMVHEAHTAAIGEAEELRRVAKTLDEISDTIADIYAARSGHPFNVVRKWMRETTWFTGKEAVNARLATSLAPLKRQQQNFAPTKAELAAVLERIDGAEPERQNFAPTRAEIADVLERIERGNRRHDRIAARLAEIEDNDYLYATLDCH